MSIATPCADDLTTADLTYTIASTPEERAAAFRLVYQSYLAAGLGEPNPYHMRVTPYQLLPTTEIFLACCRGEPIFTMSLVVDGQLGLPMECIYPEQVAERRARGLRLAEVSCLADRRQQFRGFLPVFVRLSRLMAQNAWRRGVHELVIAVHPKHARLYRRLMAFRTIGELRMYPTVRNRPAIALAVNFDAIETTYPLVFRNYFSEWLPDEALRSRPITAEEQYYFRPMIDPSFSCVPLGGESEPSFSIPAAELLEVA